MSRSFRHGVFKFNASWSLALQLVAKWGFLLPYLLPDDAVAFIDVLVTRIRPSPGKVLAPEELVFAFYLQTIKWPAVVRHIGLQAIPSSGKELVASFQAAVDFADGKPWRRVFDDMNDGLMDAQTGLAVNGVILASTYVHSFVSTTSIVIHAHLDIYA